MSLLLASAACGVEIFGENKGMPSDFSDEICEGIADPWKCAVFICVDMSRHDCPCR